MTLFELRSFSLVASALATSGVTGGARFCGNIGVGWTRLGLTAVGDPAGPGAATVGFAGRIRAEKGVN